MWSQGGQFTLPLFLFLTDGRPLVQISFSPQSSAAIKLKDGGHNAELSLAKITPALQASSEKVQGHSIESFLYFIEGPRYQFQGEIGFPA